jgi:hypothetical protein
LDEDLNLGKTERRIGRGFGAGLDSKDQLQKGVTPSRSAANKLFRERQESPAEFEFGDTVGTREEKEPDLSAADSLVAVEQNLKTKLFSQDSHQVLEALKQLKQRERQAAEHRSMMSDPATQMRILELSSWHDPQVRNAALQVIQIYGLSGTPTALPGETP